MRLLGTPTVPGANAAQHSLLETAFEVRPYLSLLLTPHPDNKRRKKLERPGGRDVPHQRINVESPTASKLSSPSMATAENERVRPETDGPLKRGELKQQGKRAAARLHLSAELRSGSDGVGRELVNREHLRVVARFVALIGHKVEDHFERSVDHDLTVDSSHVCHPSEPTMVRVVGASQVDALFWYMLPRASAGTPDDERQTPAAIPRSSR